jgi:hypothetical protein
VVNVALGAPERALTLFLAPIAPEPFVPVVSTPVKLIIVIDDKTLWDSVAVTATLVSGEAENALQTSEVPL